MEAFSLFYSRKYFICVLLIGGMFFLFYQFYVATILWQYPLMSSFGMHGSLTKKFSSVYKDLFFASTFEKKWDGSIYPYPGVLPEKQYIYRKTNETIFTCIESGTVIGFEKVNDDYCDCGDFSDEPSTSACIGGKFFCPLSDVKVYEEIPSSKVNDGICDCCDGSDEWKHVSVPYHSKMTYAVQKKLGIYHTPCENFCSA